MGTEMIQSDEWGVIQHQAQVLAASKIVPKAYQTKPDDIIAAALLGREVGWSPMTALMYIHVIDGKAGMSAEGMVSLVRSKGHSIEILQLDDNGCKVRGTRADTGDSMEYEFTKAHATQAGLLNRQVWKAYFRSMAWARVASQLCRSLWPDVIMGLSYTPEELSSIAGVEPASPPPVVVAVDAAPEMAALPAPVREAVAAAADRALNQDPDHGVIEGTATVVDYVPADPDPLANDAMRATLLGQIGDLPDDEKAALKVWMRGVGINAWSALTVAQAQALTDRIGFGDDAPDDAAVAAEMPGGAIRSRRATSAA